MSPNNKDTTALDIAILLMMPISIVVILVVAIYMSPGMM